MKAKDISLIGLFAALTAIGAYIRIPIPYIPFTLQFFFCAISGIALGSKRGMISQLVYVVVGLCGIPVFTQGGGPAYVLNPSFGYLIGFIACAYVIGRMIEGMKEVRWTKAFFSILLGLFVLYLVGVPYLYLIYNLYLNDAKSLWWAIYWGFVVCIAGDLILSYIAALLAVRLVPILRKNRFIDFKKKNSAL